MRSRLLLRIFVQLLAFAAGAAVLVWAARIALKPENRAVLERLRDAPWEYPAALCTLSLLTIVFNGLIFWVQVLPIKRMRIGNALAVNAVASLLSYLPFKVSLFFRVLIHARHDRMNLLTIGAWLASVGVVMLVVFVPLIAAGAWRQRPDLLWGVSSLAGVAALSLAMLCICGWLAKEHHWKTVIRWLDHIPMPALARQFLNKPMGPIDRVHEGVRMLAHPKAVLPAIALRLIDVSTHAARFYLAAKVLDVPLSVDQAVMAGSIFFLIGVLAPAGQLGVREGGTAALIKTIIPTLDLGHFVVVILLVSMTELLVLLVAATGGFLWLRPALRSRQSLPTSAAATGEHTSASATHREA